jgi:SAM-dependent methyltransferase
VGDDRWWNGFDALVLGVLAPGDRVLDVGCGDGKLVEHFVARGLDAFGVDPRAPRHPRLMQKRAEEVGPVGPFDAVCAVMSLHHAQLEPVLRTIGRLLRPDGRLFADEFVWEAYDERAASWVAAHSRSDTDNSVEGWRIEHRDLHTGERLRASLAATFALQSVTDRPYLARMLDAPELEREERALIAEGSLPALGRWYVAGLK